MADRVVQRDAEPGEVAVLTLLVDADRDELAGLAAEVCCPWLIAVADTLIAEGPAAPAELLLVLRQLAWAQHPEGVTRIARAAQAGLLSETPEWSAVLGTLAFEVLKARDKGDIQLVRDLLGQLPPPETAEPRPLSFLQLAILDLANSACRAAWLDAHPWDTDTGEANLEALLSDDAPDRVSGATSAASALPFVRESRWQRLLPLAVRHRSPRVQLEAAAAATVLGQSRGVEALVAASKHPTLGSLARTYLVELGGADLVPRDIDNDILAANELSDWMSHPARFGRRPDRLELVATRNGYWPPTRDARTLFLYAFSYAGGADDANLVGLGVVGSILRALPTPPVDLTTDDLFALQCAWELIERGDPRAPAEVTIEAGRAALLADPPDDL